MFGLSSTSDDWPSDLSNEVTQNAKNGHQIVKK